MIAGSWTWPWYEEACAAALTRLGHDVLKFSSFEHFHRWHQGRSEPEPQSVLRRLQSRLGAGPNVARLNRQLLERVSVAKPDVLLLYNARLVTLNALRRIRAVSPGTKLVVYCNDNPFRPDTPIGIYRHVRASLSCCDLALAYRHENLAQFLAAGAPRVALLRSYFVPDHDYPEVPEVIDRRFVCDTVFAGHFESDNRVPLLEAIVDAGFDLRLYGGGWASSGRYLRPDSPLRRFLPALPVVGSEYRQALCGSKVALCFLSTLNRDTYTRRNFQIPAMGVFLLSEFSEDLASLFVEGEEIAFFRSREELLEKLRYYLSHDAERNRIAERGRAAVWQRGHDVDARMAELTSLLAIQ
jgi:spore maturation protein CgeB